MAYSASINGAIYALTITQVAISESSRMMRVFRKATVWAGLVEEGLVGGAG